VFRRTTAGQWVEVGALESGDTSHMAFGQALALADQYAYIGAPGVTAATVPPTVDATLGRDAAPRVFAFHDSLGRWVPDAQLAPADSGTRDNASSGAGAGAGDAPDFGAALLAVGTDLLVSSPGARSGHGTVFQFRRERTGTPAGRWLERQRLVPDSSRGALAFGAALVRAGSELLIGAPATGLDTGAVFVFRRDSVADRWIEARHLTPTPGTVPFRRYTAPNARFGEVLAADSGLALAGLPGVDNVEGAATVLRREPSGEWRQTETLIDSAWTTRVRR